MNKILVDTNILIYAKDIDSIHHLPCLKFIQADNELFVTSKNLIEYLAVVTKGENPLLSTAEALEDINDFVSIFSIIYPDQASFKKLKNVN